MKNRVTFCTFCAFLGKKRVGSKVTGSESKSDITYTGSSNCGQLNPQKFWSPNFPILLPLVPNNVSKKKSEFGYFSRCHAHFFEKNKFHFLMQNLILNRLTPFKIKKEQQKACMPFCISHFSF